jgi:ABC-type glycerol-3-phosphate transport system substrate-binding protein
LKPLLLTVAAVAALGLTACGGDKAAAPLALDQRVPSVADAPGSKPDPVETRVTAVGTEEFITKAQRSTRQPHRQR